MAAAVACFLCASVRLNRSHVLTIVRNLHDTAWIEQFRVLSHFYSDTGSNNISKVTACSSQNFKSVLCVLKQKICFKQVFCCLENTTWEANTFELEIPVWNQEISDDSSKSFLSENHWLISCHTFMASQHFMMPKKTQISSSCEKYHVGNLQEDSSYSIQNGRFWFFRGCKTQKYPTNSEFSV